jgi:hypothetical protein
MTGRAHFIHYIFFRSAFVVWGIFYFVVADAQKKNADQKTNWISISLSSFYRMDDFKWSIAGNSNGSNPNIYSEIYWKKLRSTGISANIDWQFREKFVLNTSFSRSFIAAGKVTDNDYKGDNRTNQSYAGLFNANKGDITSLSVMFGYLLGKGKKWVFTPYLGALIAHQLLYLLPADVYTPSDLHSTYSAMYKGAMAGLDLKIIPAPKAVIGLSGWYGALDYTAKANWNLIPQFRHPVSFEHEANGFAFEIGVKGEYFLNPAISVYLKSTFARWYTEKGVDRLYLVNGQTNVSQFNGSTQNTFTTGAGVCLSFGRSIAK